MNIFILDENPHVCATQMCDKHVVKMILETAQMLCSAHPKGDAPYKRTHYNHPCTVWSRESKQNYDWLITHGYALHGEYLDRYNRVHKCLSIIEWCEANKDSLNLPDIGLTKFAQAMPEEYKQESAVQAYRDYYIHEKSQFAFWKSEKIPSWFKFKAQNA